MEIALQECINLKGLRTRNYIRFIINSKKKEAEKLYNSKFNPFYKWEVGRLFGYEIKKALTYYIDNNETNPKVINHGEETVIEYSILIKVFEAFSCGIHPGNLTNRDWSLIRDEYEKSSKKERECTFGLTFIDDHNSQLQLDENNELDFIKEDLEGILDDIYQGNWSVTIVNQAKDIFTHRLIVINLFIPTATRNKILNILTDKIGNYFCANYGKNEVAVKSINGIFFIDGYFTFK